MSFKIASRLDWITATINGVTAPELIIPLGKIGLGDKINPSRWYDVAYQLEPAGTFQGTHGKTANGLLQLTGTDLHEWRMVGWHDTQIMEYLYSNGARFTRLDFAVDVLGAGSPQDCLALREQGMYSGNHRRVEQIKSAVGSGHTVYFGSRQSERYVRVYDKAAEQKLLGEVWTRIELQARKERSDVLAKDMRKATIGSAGRAAIKTVVDFPALFWWANALRADNVALSKIPRRQASVVRWLLDQVAPAFRKKHS